ncbi:MAG: preprotein translocase subunit SecY [Pseudobutyrivibrio sp.]|nr:preprotein translocase subunit SecY [Pseudobutyrivibrio sp.]
MKDKFFPKTLFQKTIYAIGIMALYLVGREIPLYGVDLAAYDAFRDHNQDLIMQTIGGDRYKTSLFALGISPFMFSMLFVQVFVSIKNADSKNKTSPKKITQATLLLMLVWSILQAFFTVSSTIYIYDGGIQLLIAQIISGMEMVTGAFVILYLATRNGKYGVGGQTILILVNILDSVVNTVRYAEMPELEIIGALGILAMVFTIIFENSEYRIPMQRISIHNIYSDKNYIPIKLNPIGMMPVMFASAAFMIPMYVLQALSMLMPNDKNVHWALENMNTTKPLGAITYVVILYIITLIFSYVFISPKNLAENMQKSGDSIMGLKAGRKTKRFIGFRLNIIALFSATFFALFIGLPFYLQIEGLVSAEIMSLPSVLIALASINCNLYRETVAVKDYDAYNVAIF